MSGRKLKARVLEILDGRDLPVIQSRLGELDANDVLHGLFSGICSSSENIRWHAIAAMGPSVARLAAKDMEAARIVMRRLLWSLNDESGGIGWGAPEAMAEIMVSHQGLAEEYIHMLISYMREDGEELFQDGNYLEHVVLQRGLLWGMARLAESRPDILRERQVVPDILPYLRSPDAAVRGMAARSLGLLDAGEALAELRALQGDMEQFRMFDGYTVRTTTVAAMTGKAIDRITQEESC